MKRPPRVLFFAEGPTACSDIVLEPFVRLSESGVIRLKVMFESSSGGVWLRTAARFSDIVFAFRACTRRAEKTCHAAQAAGTKVIWASDDDFFTIDIRNPVGARHHDPETKAATVRMISMADMVWVFSPVMAREYQRFGRPLWLTPAWAPIQSNIATPMPRSPITVGYIGGPAHEDEALPLIEAIQLLDSWKSEEPWRIECVGCRFDALVDHPRVGFVPYIPSVPAFHGYLGQAGWQIGVAPLRDTPFNRCKTDNKFRTFAAFGIAGVYSNVVPYRDAVEDHRTGLLVANDADGFASGIAELIHDKMLRDQISLAAQCEARRRYRLEDITPLYQQGLQAVLRVA